MIPAWVYFASGLACVGLAVNFFHMAYKTPGVGALLLTGTLDAGSYRPLTVEESIRNNIPLKQNNSAPSKF
jgi:hypothetical protein